MIVNIGSVRRDHDHGGRRVYVEATVEGTLVKYTVEHKDFAAIRVDKGRRTYLAEKAVEEYEARKALSGYDSLLGVVHIGEDEE